MSALRVVRSGNARLLLTALIWLVIGLAAVWLLSPESALAATDDDPYISGLSVAQGPVGTQLTISGVDFNGPSGSGPMWGSVHFRTTTREATAAIVSWTNTQIVCTVPVLPAGPAAVRVWKWTEYFVWGSDEVPFTIDLSILSLTSSTHPVETTWYRSRSATFAWEGPPTVSLIGAVTWDEETFSGPGLIEDLAVDGGLAYLANMFAGLVIVDVSDPATPDIVGTYYEENVEVDRVAVHGGYAYLGVLVLHGGASFEVVDVRTPSAPQYVGEMTWNEGDCTVDSILVSGSRAYVLVTWKDSSIGKILKQEVVVLDLTNPVAPQQTGSCVIWEPGAAGADGNQLALDGSTLYVGGSDTGDEFVVVDVTDPANPVLMGYGDDPSESYCAGPAASPGYVYAGSSGHVDVYDVSDPSAPVPVSTAKIKFLSGQMDYRQEGAVSHVVLTDTDATLKKHYAFASYEDGGVLSSYERIRLLDVSDPLHPRNAGEIGTAWDGSTWSNIGGLTFRGDHLYAGSHDMDFGVWHLGPAAYSYSLDQNPSGTADTTPDGTQSGLDADHALTAPGDGVYYFHVRAKDDYGTWGPTVTRAVQIDTTAPTASDNADDSWHQGGFTVNLSGSDAASGFNRWFVNFSGGYAGYLYSSSVTKTYPTWKRGGGSGTYSFSYRAYDKAGNSTSLITKTVKIDGKPPQTGDDAPRDSAGAPVPQAQALSVHLTPSDQAALSGVKETWWSLDGGTWTKGTSVSVPAQNGYHFVRYYSVDNAGNSESVRTCTVRMVISAKAVHRGLAARRT